MERKKALQIMSLPAYDKAIAEYNGSEDLKAAYERYGLCGIEIIRCDENAEKVIKPDMIKGVHMIFYPVWLDFFIDNEEGLFAEFGNRYTWENFYGGADFTAVMSRFNKDLEYAKMVGAEYVVFHVSDVTIKGVFTHKHTHTDKEVIDAACKIINLLLDDKHYDFDFLVENLWWPGFTMTDPQLTNRLISGIHYKRKGIMLDTGHLLCTNMDIENQEEGCRYILDILDKHEKAFPGICEYIKGIHLHQSISGKYAKEILKEEVDLKEDYYDRFAQVYEELGYIDTHCPWETESINAVIDKVSPHFLVHEIQATNRQERERLIKIQVSNLQLL